MSNFELPRRFSNLLDSFTPEQKERLIGPNSSMLNEEIDNICNNIPSQQLMDSLRSLTESYNVINSLEKSGSSNYDKDGEITQENWKFFTTTLTQLASYSFFQEKSKETYCKLYAIKFFTKGNFVSEDAIEDNLKHTLKEYYSRLLTNNPQEFTETLFGLPLDFVGLIIRYTSHELAPNERTKLVPTKKEAEAYLDKLLEKKKKFIEIVGKIVNEENNVLSITDAHMLVETRAFIEDIDVHNGVLEYLLRLINNKPANKKLVDLFGNDLIKELKENILAHPNYKKYLTKIKHGEAQPFFDLMGLQNKNATPSFAEVVEEYLHPELAAIRKAEEEENPEEATVPMLPPAPEVPATQPPAGQPEQIPVVTNEPATGGLSAEIPSA